ncbi:MAG TPA: hypothetical protein PK569_22820 [Thermoanaerobaculia bacterium]|nr:hypothetical protein [Thermoanaerobaculia bacterium]
MPTSRASTRRAALAAFLLFAAALFVVGPAEASRTTDARSSLASLELSLLESVALAESIAPVESSPRFGFTEDLGLLDPERGPGGFVVFAREASRCELTYARNNPVTLVDSTGRLAELAGCAAKDGEQCAAEFNVVKESVGKKAAAHLRVDAFGRLQVIGATREDFAAFGNQAAVLGALIGQPETYRFDGAPVTGGFFAQNENEYNPANRTIFLDLKGFPRNLGGVSVSAAEAFVHESAHALWHAFPGIGAAIGAKTNPGWSLFGPSWPGANEGFATAMENQWRRDVGLEKLRQYYSRPGDYVDPGRRLRVVQP